MITPDHPWYDAIRETLGRVGFYTAQRLEQLCRGASGSLPRMGDDELLNSDLGLTLQDLAAVAEGEDRSADPGEVHDQVQSVCEALFARPGTAAYDIPPDWWATGVGRLCRLALAVVTGGEDLMTIAEAAAELGVTTQAVSGAISRGDLRAVTDPEGGQRNQYGARRLVFRDEVERLRQERGGGASAVD